MSSHSETGTGFNEFFRHSMAVMLLIDPATRQICDANQAAEQYYGWNYRELTSKTIDQINTLTPAEIELEINKARNQQRSYFKFKHRKANGSVCSVELFSTKVFRYSKLLQDLYEILKINGISFYMKYSERIFEIFQRLHRAEEYPGTSNGLAMVAKAVQRMNGKVWAESAPSQGASFYVQIPKS